MINRLLIIKTTILNIIFLIFFTNIVSALTNAKIVFKIDNEIVTNFDVEKEYKYLIALNPNLRTLSEDQILEITKKSIIRETIKKLELAKFFEFGENPEYMETVVKDFFKDLNIKNRTEIIDYLKEFELTIDEVTKKLEVETMWNELVFTKYKNQLQVDEDKLKGIINKKIASNQFNEVSYLLSEILFSAPTTKELSDKVSTIKKNIDQMGFESTAATFSTSPSANKGGDLGWINESKLSEPIQLALKKIDIGKFTNNISIPGGAIILKIRDKKLEKIELDFEKELNTLLNAERNRQLNQFSTIYFNKIKQNSTIND